MKHSTGPSVVERVVVVLAFAVTLITNTMANVLPIGGQTTGAISDKYPTLFTPAGFTFSIWGIIYIGLGAYVIYQTIAPSHTRPLLRKITPWFVINCMANALWIFAWHYEVIWASLGIMLVLLATLGRIFWLVSEDVRGNDLSWRWFVRTPFSIYLAWICVATIANASVLQAALGWGTTGTVAIVATIAKIAAAGAIGAWVLVKWGNRPFPLVIAWAAFGIARNQSDVAPVSGAAWFVLGVLVLLVGAGVFRRPNPATG